MIGKSLVLDPYDVQKLCFVFIVYFCFDHLALLMVVMTLCGSF